MRRSDRSHFAIFHYYVVAISAIQLAFGLGLTECLTDSLVPQILPSSPDFTPLTRSFNLRLSLKPSGLIIPTSEAQIQSALACAAQNNVKVAARSGGHSYAAHGLGGADGYLVVDMRNMSSVLLDTDTNIATVGPGARLGKVATEIYKQGKRGLSHGTCPGVGLGGQVLGGGYGLSSRTHGLTLDALTSATIVLANGTIAKASPSENPSLFWALRGAGASFGIVTSLSFNTFPAPESNILFGYTFNISTAEMAKKIFTGFHKYSADAVADGGMPKEMNARFTLNRNAITTGVVSLSGAFHGSQEDYDKAILGLFSKTGEPIPRNSSSGGTTRGNVRNLGWMDTLLSQSNVFRGGLEMPDNYDLVTHETFFAKSLMTTSISAAAWDSFISYFFNTAVNVTRDWYIIVDLHGGPSSAITTVPANATAYPHRNAILKWQFYDRIPLNETGVPFPEGGADFLNSWVNTITSSNPQGGGLIEDGTVPTDDTTGPWGMYYNYADTSLSSAEAHRYYWGVKGYNRLQQIKREMDPTQLVGNAQGVQA